jgi:uncharacterized protein (DUF1800 family)
LNADFFKQAQFARVKSPVELVVGAVRLAGGHRFPDVSDINLGLQAGFMGQQLLDPPSVEGWHTGNEWINTASLMTRINFASEQFANAALPGVRSIIESVKAQDATASADRLVDACLDFMGPMTVSETTRQELVEHAAECLDQPRTGVDTAAVTQELLQLIVSTREYQLA